MLPLGIPRVDFERISKAYLDKLASCRGRLTQKEEASALSHLLSLFGGTGFADLDSCRNVASMGLNLDPAQSGDVAKQIAQDFGHCGGDCAKVGSKKMKTACETGAKTHAAELTGKLPLDFEAEQPVPCEPGKARKLIENMDKHAFGEQALRFIAKYRADCSKALQPPALESLANDEAFVRFHSDDDAGCLKVLDSVVGPASPATAYNRALCGGPCSLEPAKCASAVEARKKALVGRGLRAKLRETSRAFCWYCNPGKPCNPPPRDQVSRSVYPVLSWDLKTFRWVGGGKVERESDGHDAMEPRHVYWKGDLNGDGIGDFISVDRREFYVYLGDGRGFYGLRFTDDANRLNSLFEGVLNGVRGGGFAPTDLVIRVFEKPGSAVKAACIFSDGRAKCARKGCNDDPLGCADLSAWEQTEKAVRP
jgi:hypothetical protein